MLFFVRDSRNKILFPSNKQDWAEKQVKRGKARWIRRKYIILQLNYEVNEEPRDQISYFVVGLDTGYQYIGFAVYKITGNKSQKLFFGTGVLRTKEIKELLAERKMYRNSRRYNQRQNNPTPKFKYPKSNRTKSEVEEMSKVYTPTVRHLIASHLRTLDLIHKLVPKDKLVLNLEYASFDMQKITRNKNKTDVGTGGNEKQFVLQRDQYTCQYCGQNKGEMQVHHKIQRSKGGTNNPSNLITLCPKCHKLHHAGKINANLSDTRQFRQTTLNAAIPEIYKKLAKEIPVYKYYGYETKEYRRANNIDKSHTNDASCLALMGLRIDEAIDYNIELDYQQFRRHRRAIIIRSEDRKYYRPDDMKHAVAWNRNRRSTQDPAKPSLNEYRKTNIGVKLVAKPGGRIRYKEKYGISWKTPGVVVRDKNTGLIHVARSTGQKGIYCEIGLLKNKELEVIKQYSGLVLI